MTRKTGNIFRQNRIKFASLLLVPIVLTMITVDISGVMDNKNGSIDTGKDIINTTVINETIIQYPDVTTIPHQNVTINETVVQYQDVVETNDAPVSYDIVVPEFNVTLWKYSASCSRDGFIGSCQPQKYIMPNNEVVQFVSSLMVIDKNGKLSWEKCPFKECGIFTNMYVSDNVQFNSPPYGDYWINPDYYFLNGLKGDCEDSAFAVASVFESKDIRTKIIMGFIGEGSIRDFAVEYKINGTYYRYYGGVPHELGYGKQEEVGFVKRDQRVDFVPSMMFDKNTYYEDYVYDW